MIIDNVGDLTLFNLAVLFNCAANNLYTMAVDIQICLKLFTLFNNDHHYVGIDVYHAAF